jgi:hypothetical protein
MFYFYDKVAIRSSDRIGEPDRTLIVWRRVKYFFFWNFRFLHFSSGRLFSVRSWEHSVCSILTQTKIRCFLAQAVNFMLWKYQRFMLFRGFVLPCHCFQNIRTTSRMFGVVGEGSAGPLLPLHFSFLNWDRMNQMVIIALRFAAVSWNSKINKN